jgi:hypothetical protein
MASVARIIAEIQKHELEIRSKRTGFPFLTFRGSHCGDAEGLVIGVVDGSVEQSCDHIDTSVGDVLSGRVFLLNRIEHIRIDDKWAM